MGGGDEEKWWWRRIWEVVIWSAINECQDVPNFEDVEFSPHSRIEFWHLIDNQFIDWNRWFKFGFRHDIKKRRHPDEIREGCSLRKIDEGAHESTNTHNHDCEDQKCERACLDRQTDRQT